MSGATCLVSRWRVVHRGIPRGTTAMGSATRAPTTRGSTGCVRASPRGFYGSREPVATTSCMPVGRFRGFATGTSGACALPVGRRPSRPVWRLPCTSPPRTNAPSRPRPSRPFGPMPSMAQGAERRVRTVDRSQATCPPVRAMLRGAKGPRIRYTFFHGTPSPRSVACGVVRRGCAPGLR